MLAPGPSQVFKFFKSKGRRRRNHEQKVNKVNKVLVQQISFSRSPIQQKWAIKTIKMILMLTPGLLVQQISFFDRKILMLAPGPLDCFGRAFSGRVFEFFKSKGRRRRPGSLAPGPLERFD